MLLGFMGSRCCRSTVSAYSTCPLNQSSASARRLSGHLPSWQSPRGRKGAEKINKSSETCRVKRFPLPGDGTPKAPLARCGAHPRCAGVLGAGPASPPGSPAPDGVEGRAISRRVPLTPARVPQAGGRRGVRPVPPHLPGSATLGASGFCSSAAPQPVHDAMLAIHPGSRLWIKLHF